MKRARIIYYAVMVFCLFGGLVMGQRPWFLVVFSQIFLLMTGMALNLWTIAAFSYVQRVQEKIAVKGGTVTLHLGIYNDKPFPLTRMRVYVAGVAQDDAAVLSFNLAPYSNISFDLPISCLYRGKFDVGMTRIHIEDIFGLCPMTFKMSYLPYYKPLGLLVYPYVPELSIAPAGVRDEKYFAASGVVGAEHGDSFSSVREYREGDSAKRVHWKISMRQRRLYTKQHETPVEENYLFFLDSNPGALSGKELLVYADMVCEAAAALIRPVLQQGYGIFAVSSTEAALPVAQSGLTGFRNVYDWLALLDFNGTQKIGTVFDYEVSRRSGGSTAYIFTQTLDDTLCDALARAAHRGVNIVCILFCGDYAGTGAAFAAKPAGIRFITVILGENVAKALEAAL